MRQSRIRQTRLTFGRYKIGRGIQRARHSLAAPDFLGAHEHPATYSRWRWQKTTFRTWTNPGDVVLDPMAGSGTVRSVRQRTWGVLPSVLRYTPITCRSLPGRMAQGVLV